MLPQRVVHSAVLPWYPEELWAQGIFTDTSIPMHALAHVCMHAHMCTLMYGIAQYKTIQNNQEQCLGYYSRVDQSRVDGVQHRIV